MSEPKTAYKSQNGKLLSVSFAPMPKLDGNRTPYARTTWAAGNSAKTAAQPHPLRT